MANRRILLLLLAVLPFVPAACAGSAPRERSAQEGATARSGVRSPTPQERRRIVSTVNEIWKYESGPPASLPYRYGVRLRRPRLRPHVVSVRISRADERYASAVVVLRGRTAGRRRQPAVIVLERSLTSPGGWGHSVAGPALSFPRSCTFATPKGLRDLLCPNPWSVLDYARPRLHAQTAYLQRVRSPDLHAVDWRTVTLPGGVCGSSRPIRPHRYRYGPEALVHPDVDLLWWNPVVVSSWSPPLFGDLDGDGRDEAALQVVCSNGGGMAAGQLAFSAVVFKGVGSSMRVVGILTPRQPLTPGTSHVPLNRVVAIERGRVVVSEAWYGPYDGTCCSSGTARTIWRYVRGRLRTGRTTVLERPWTSPLNVADVVVYPGGYGLRRFEATRVAVSPRLAFSVIVENLGPTVVRDVEVTLRLRGSRSSIARTRTIERIAPWAPYPPRAVFRDLGRPRVGERRTVTIDVEHRGTNRVRYVVIFTR